MFPSIPSCEPLALPPLSGIHVETVARPAKAGAVERFAHFHDACEIVLFERVSGTLLAQDCAIPLSAGSLVILPSMMPHDFVLDPGRSAWTLAQVAPWLTESIEGVHREELISSTLAPGEIERARMLLDWLSRAARPADTLAILTLLFSLVRDDRARGGQPSATDQPKPTIAVTRLRAVLDRLHARPADPLSCAEAASLAAMSPSHFSRVFRRIMGQSFSDYVVTYRLQVAAHLLLTTLLPVASIAFRSGFTSPSRFTALFRRRFAVTPRQYRVTHLDRGQARRRGQI